jgi:predicted HicB family RNase H-like nuclease
MKRKQKGITPSQALAKTTKEEKNVDLKEVINEKGKEENKVERKRVSFDLRTDLHKELKLQALMQEKNIYILIEEALEKYLKENK